VTDIRSRLAGLEAPDGVRCQRGTLRRRRSDRGDVIVVIIVPAMFPRILPLPSAKRVNGKDRHDKQDDKQERVHGLALAPFAVQ
jgi:hypothetical protein